MRMRLAAAIIVILTPAAVAAGYPPADRPIAEIVSPVRNDPARRDKADESGRIVRALGIISVYRTQ